jgi:hypothetical protein
VSTDLEVMLSYHERAAEAGDLLDEFGYPTGAEA